MDSLKQIRETFKQMRAVFQASRQEMLAAHQAMRTEQFSAPVGAWEQLEAPGGLEGQMDVHTDGLEDCD